MTIRILKVPFAQQAANCVPTAGAKPKIAHPYRNVPYSSIFGSTNNFGRFNLAQGLVALSTGLGAAASNLYAGFVVQVFGYTIGFLTLAAIAVGRLVFFACLMPETKPEEDIGSASTKVDIPAAKSVSG